MPDLTSEERTRLVGILGRLGSTFDGERAAAGLLASRLLKARGLSWEDLLGKPSRPKAPPPGGNRCGDLQFCLRHLAELSEWEQQFIVSARGFRRLSPKQAEVVRGIADTLRRYGFE